MRTEKDLLNDFDWRQIPNCRGRFTLAEQNPDMTITELLGKDCRPVEIASVMARDKVLVVPLEDGGVISYQRASGTFLHTLNTPDGFLRKLRDLRIDASSLQAESES